MPRVTHPTPAVVTLPSGAYRAVKPGDVLEPDDPFAVAFPWLFTAPAERATVEQATAAPGERRNVRRPRS
jgi:hypothetical protein